MNLMIVDSIIEFETENYKFIGNAIEDKKDNILISVTEEFIGISLDDKLGQELYPTRYIGKIDGETLKEIAIKLKDILEENEKTNNESGEHIEENKTLEDE